MMKFKNITGKTMTVKDGDNMITIQSGEVTELTDVFVSDKRLQVEIDLEKLKKEEKQKKKEEKEQKKKEEEKKEEKAEEKPAEEPKEEKKDDKKDSFFDKVKKATTKKKGK